MEPSKTTSQVRGQPSAGGIAENGARSRRTIKLTRKALHNAIDNKRKEFRNSRKRLLSVMQLVDGLGDDSDIATLARDLTAASEEFGELLKDLFELYKQDVYGDFVEEAQLEEESDTLKRALSVIEKLKNKMSRQSNELLETRSVSSRHSSVSKTSSAIARLQALADANAAKEEAQYTRLMAEKELERKTREAETERTRQQERAQFEKDMAILGADKRAAIANAKLKVFEDAFLEEGLGEDLELPEFKNPQIKTEESTSQWVHSSPLLELSPTGNLSRQETAPKPLVVSEEAEPLLSPPPKPKTSEKTDQSHVLSPYPKSDRKFNDSQAALNQQPLISSTPLRDNAGSQLIDSLTVVNQQIVAGLARQNLPKCQPDVFSGDSTLFHPWKAAFKAMLIDTDVSPTQEINYLRSFTSGTSQRLVDNYRKRQRICGKNWRGVLGALRLLATHCWSAYVTQLRSANTITRTYSSSRISAPISRVK